ncbi:MAG: hypothetical protein KGI80_03360 [Verrucomicrobiota bacterium]|nr:hypothetical protein [Verrucomicrobiota bacterium]
MRLSFLFLVLFLGKALAVQKPVSQVENSNEKPCSLITLTPPDCYVALNFSALIMQPLANNLNYGAQATFFDYGITGSALSPSWTVPSISPDLQFGFDLGLMGVFPMAKSFLSVDWERFHTSGDSSSFNVAEDSFMVGPFYEVGPDAFFFKDMSGDVVFHFDEVNADYGSRVQFGKYFALNLSAGAGFFRLVQDLTFHYSGGDVARRDYTSSEFIGGGPQLGCCLDYEIVKCFKFTWKGLASIFAGVFTTNTEYRTTSTQLISESHNPNNQSTTVYNKNGIVPGFDNRIGFLYECRPRKHTLVMIEAGYRVQTYINAIRTIVLASEVALPPVGSLHNATTGVYARTFDYVNSDFSLMGPYISLNLGF